MEVRGVSGSRPQSTEKILGTADGIFHAQSVRRRPKDSRYDRLILEGVSATPWSGKWTRDPRGDRKVPFKPAMGSGARPREIGPKKTYLLKKRIYVLVAIIH